MAILGFEIEPVIWLETLEANVVVIIIKSKHTCHNVAEEMS